MNLPGLIDPHVHLREPGGTHKEDWDTGTQAALAGGFSMVLAMPNTQPPVIDRQSLKTCSILAAQKARCDYGLYLGASITPLVSGELAALAPYTVGLKMYLNHTYGPLMLDNMSLWMHYFEYAPKHMPIAAHAEGHTLAAAILMAELFNHPLHLCHVSSRDEILLIREAKEKGLPITCEVTPHHLFLTEDDLPRIGNTHGQVHPELKTKADQQALWDNLDFIDCFATDHAPHTLAEKDSSKPAPGFPGLETALPLLLTAVSEGRLTMQQLIERCYTNPRKIFHLPQQPETNIEVDLQTKWEIKAENTFTRCGWTPFEGMQVKGKVIRVTLRGKTVFQDGRILAEPGYGKNIKKMIT